MQTKQAKYAAHTKLSPEGMQPIAQVLQATSTTPSTQSTQSAQSVKLTQIVRCPNCGELAERHYLGEHEMTRTQCASCDYLMILCTNTGRVVEAYAPGIRTH